ncbi:hypothetical protein [Streptomyces europaeiscabiei]|uniref:Uncharacterized protein n=1 Tax=Streptomyces europaeiscabiei TaxID=146819 RepID=A0ABU4NZY5_9ACTN|nr:hypothetical protein [Streptomyces europaeiscabiei]MDX2528014.1 hypothetical protein [Streptomyces europaeiscabiei]MDX3559370.1 hypothetical protein [Streptomyces europaeiscabiei]MDX3707357.1 hypothetical protein [Streptomyces europaeiscabiei]
MIRETRFLISRKPFAVDLATVTGSQHPRGERHAFSGTANALWFRRQAGVTRACLGTLKLWSHYLPEPLDLDDPHAILSADLDGRYGGDTDGRWDGTGYWGAEVPDIQEQHLAILRPMLANYPEIPPGYDGWWTFQPAR